MAKECTVRRACLVWQGKRMGKPPDPRSSFLLSFLCTQCSEALGGPFSLNSVGRKFPLLCAKQNGAISQEVGQAIMAAEHLP